MGMNIDYSYLLNQMFGTSNNSTNAAAGHWIKMDDLSSPSVQSQLKAAGIDTGSKQYKTVIKSMMDSGRPGGYTTVSAIKNRMSRYDKDGDWINPRTGLAGLLVTDKNRASKDRIISISDSIRNEMFEQTKKEFLQENGVHNGDTTNRSDVYQKLYRNTEKNDRLAAGHTLGEYERIYWEEFVSAVKAVDPKWEAGKPIPSGALNGITRESIESQLVVSGSSLVKKSSASAATYSTYSNSAKTNSISRVENAFSESLKNNPPKTVQAKEMEVGISNNVAAEKMKRLEEQLRDGTFKPNSDFDMKA